MGERGACRFRLSGDVLPARPFPRFLRVYVQCMYVGTKRMNFRLPEVLVRQADIAAEVTHKNRTGLLVEALREYLREIESEEGSGRL